MVVLLFNGVATGNWQLATGDGENLTATAKRRPMNGCRCRKVFAVAVASCQLPIARFFRIALGGSGSFRGIESLCGGIWFGA
jgi:hypothetical protein